MKNKERYKDLIESYGLTCKKVKELVNKNKPCNSLDCMGCYARFTLWLDEEAEEDKVDWTKVKVDTPILVSDDGVNWIKKYFSKYENGKVYTFCGGSTSWSHPDIAGLTDSCWKYAKLAREE